MAVLPLRWHGKSGAKRISLRVKIFIPLLMGGLFLLFFSAYYIMQQTEKRLQEKLQLRAELIANAIGYTAQSFEYGGELQRLVSSLGADRDVEDIVVIGGHPVQVRASSKPRWLHQSLDDLTDANLRDALADALSAHSGNVHVRFQGDDSHYHHFYYALHLVLALPDAQTRGLQNGAVAVVMNAQTLEDELWQTTLDTMGFAFLAIAGAGLWVWLALQRQFLTPLQSVSTTVEARAQGDATARTRLGKRDELGQLATAVDALFDQLDEEEHGRKAAEALLVDSRRALHDTNGALRHRNAELETTNEQLASAQSQLLQSEKMAAIGQLAAGVAHEINNPIGYINSNLKTLERDVTDLLQIVTLYEALEATLGVDTPDSSAPVKEASAHKALKELQIIKTQLDLNYLKDDLPMLVRETHEGSSRITQIVRSLRDFSRSDASEPWQQANIENGLDSSLHIAWNELKHKAEIIKEYGEVGEIECMPSQLNQVFLNLLINAGHAIEGKGTIWIRTQRTPHRVWIEIADSGCGMAPAVVEKIFDPFFTTKPVGKGTGLGLAVSYGIIQKHGGEIIVQSKPGEGTCFRIGLPPQHVEAASASE